MRCSKCGSENLAGKKFCGDCGAQLANRCPECGADNPLGKRFCSDCGVALSAKSDAAQSPASFRGTPDIAITAEGTGASIPVDGERKTVTALFADIKGSMDLMEDLDPEEARAIVDPALRVMIDAARRYDGYIVQSTGDGIFALFGAPLAYEDHPQRALYAALRMQEDLKRYSDRRRVEGKQPLQVRVGVNTGEVIVRSITTGEAQVEYTPIGHSTGLAARMQALAPIGSIAATQRTQGLCEGYFAFKSLGPTTVKGVSEPINVYEVTGIGPLRTRLQRAAARGLTKFVGREREMETLRHALEQAETGHGQIVAAIAEPGLGKSRLFYEFKATSQSGCMVLEAWWVSHGKASAYLPVIELLKNYFEITSEDEERKRREKITGKVLTLDRGLEDTLPYLFVLLDVHGDDDLIAQLEPQLRRRTLEAIKRVVVRESLNQPLIVIFEDLHWIDAETQALLNLLVEALATVRILLLVNYRPEYQHPWNSKTYYLQLRLDPLRAESAEEMLTALLGDDEGLVTLRRLIIDKTEGNPFFIEEMVQALFEQGVLVRNGALKLTTGLNDIRVRSTVQAVLASRIDRLPSGAKELLQTLAVIGREFSLRLVRYLVATSDEELERLLSALQVAEFIYEQPAPGGVEYTFKHALTQEVAYSSVLLERRKALHERTGAAIERLFADRLDDYVTDLAHHYDRSGNLPKAVKYLERAGRRAAEQAAHLEAVGYLTRALELIKQLPDSAEHAHQELEILITLSVSQLVAVGVGSPEREQTLVRALQLCEQLGDSRMMEVMLSLGGAQGARSEPLLALELFGRILALAQEANDPQMLGAAHVGTALSLQAQGQLEKARDHLEQAIDFFSGSPIRRFGQVMGMALSAPLVLGLVLLALGYPIRALERSKTVLESLRPGSEPFVIAAALAVNLQIYLGLRNLGAAAEQVDQLAAITAEHEMPTWNALGAFYRAWFLADGGKVREGLSEMLRVVTQLGAYPPVNWLVVALVEVCCKNGLTDEGLDILNEALSRSEKTSHLQAEFYRLKGELTVLKDPRSEPEAERYIRQAIDVARRQAARLFELRATTSLARLLAKQDRRDEARTMLAEIYNWFTEGFDTADLKEAKALLNELS
jgi:class 3 adenylate cyclase